MTFFIEPSSHNSHIKIELLKISLSMAISSIRANIDTAIGKSNLFQVFLISLGDRFTTNFLAGNLILEFLNVNLILSLASFIVVSANHTISIVGIALFLSDSISIIKDSNQRLEIL